MAALPEIFQAGPHTDAKGMSVDILLDVPETEKPKQDAKETPPETPAS